MKIEKRLSAYAKIKKNTNVKEEKLQQTIRKSKEAFWIREKERSVSWLEFLFWQGTYIQKRWWLAQGIVIIISWGLLFLAKSSIYTRRCMGILAPVFIIMILPELWKNRSNGAMEIEGAAYFSLKKIYAARMLLFGMVDVSLLTIFGIVSVWAFQIAFIDLLIQFILPLNVTCCICFRSLCGKGSESMFLSLLLCLVWASIWTLVVLQDTIYESISPLIWGAGIIFSSFYLCYSIWLIWKKSETYYESNCTVEYLLM